MTNIGLRGIPCLSTYLAADFRRTKTENKTIKIMNNNLIISNAMPDTRCWGSVLDGIKLSIKGWVREAVVEAIEEKMNSAFVEDRLLTTDELCERWHINKNTLHTREKNGIIKPISMDGKRKMYSLAEVRDVEMSGMIKKSIIC